MSYRCLLLIALLVFPSITTGEEVEVAVAPPLVGWLELSGSLEEAPPPFAWVAAEETSDTLAAVLRQLGTVAEGDRYEGIVLYLANPRLRRTQIQAIGASIQRIRDAGKHVLVFAESYSLSSYLLASYADEILLQKKGEVMMMGLSMEEMYLAGLLEKIGARADMVQIGQYKGANETMTRHEPSEAWNENISALLDDLYEQTLTTIAKNRGVQRDTVEGWLGETWTMADTDLLEAGIVDQLVTRDLVDATEIAYGDTFKWDGDLGLVSATRQMDSPFAVFSMLFQKTQVKTQRPTLAIIHANGAITSGHSGYGGGLFDEQSIGSRTMIRALGEARDDENIKGVVIQLDSPGGSALASEMIWQAVRETAETKPVYVSVGPMAASGGYYIASACDQIYVHPQTIVGSIGVVGGKIILGSLYTKAGIRVTQRVRGPMAGIFNSVDPFTIAQRDAVRESMQQVYDQFLDRVRIGRGTRLPDPDSVAEGRLFTGRTAIDNGMADKVGSLEDSIDDLAESLGLEAGQYDLLHLPPAISLGEYLENIFDVRTAELNVQVSPAIDFAKQLLGPAAWSNASRSLQGMMLLRSEPVLTLMPSVIVVR